MEEIKKKNKNGCHFENTVTSPFLSRISMNTAHLNNLFPSNTGRTEPSPYIQVTFFGRENVEVCRRQLNIFYLLVIVKTLDINKDSSH